MDKQAQRHIILGVGGGIAAYKSATVVRRLQEAGYRVRVVMTAGAQAFMTPLTFQALSGEPVHTQLLDEQAENGMGHIELARWADLILIVPASANVIARLAAGQADDLLTTLVLATTAPVIVAPAMNQQMYNNIFTQRNLTTLKHAGINVIEPASGVQACGDIGAGRLPEPDYLVAWVKQFFTQNQTKQHQSGDICNSLAALKVVITAGPTQEAIDPVRYISNHSSGKMGFALAQACQAAGAQVTLIAGPVHLPTPEGATRIDIVSALELLAQSEQAVAAGCDVFIAAAAVADYRVASIAPHKIKKSDETLPLELVKNPDIVAHIARLTPRPFIVGFAAETQHMEHYAQGKLTSKKLDMIACNDVSRQDIGFGADDNAMMLFFAPPLNLNPVRLEKAPKLKIAEALVEQIAQALKISKMTP